MLQKVLILALIASLSIGWEFHRTQLFPNAQTYTLNQSIFEFDQIIDHYNYQTSQTWKQRYFVYSDYFDPAKGPIFLYICGQAECRGVSDLSIVVKMAEENNGLVVALEHRYYGKSMPFGDDSLNSDKIKYLSSEQALRDLGYFLTQMKNSGLHRIQPTNPWIVVGGSYAGAMSAWFRNKYPHLTIGSISSSGVVVAVEDFRMFDEQIYVSSHKSGDFCNQAIVNVTNYVEAQVTGDNKDQFKASFNASYLTAREFLFYWSDVIVFQIQYGKRVSFCDSLKGLSLEEQFNLIKKDVLQVAAQDYSAQYLANVTYARQNGGGARSWFYQCCTEFSYFQTYAQEHPMRSRMLTIDFYRKLCDDIFGNGQWPYTDRVNNEFGGQKLNTNNLIMTNGGQDPWQWAGVRKTTKPGITAMIADCDNCAHCADLRVPSKNDPKELANIKQFQLSSVKKWVSEYWKSLQKSL